MEPIIKTVCIFLLGTARYFLVTLLVFYIFYKWFKDYFKNTKIQDREAKRKDFLREIGNSLFANLVMTALAGVFLFTPLIEYTQFYEDDSFPVWWPFVTAFVALILHDTYFYWIHRAVHHPKLFKAVHLTHHKSTNPSPFASYSFHFQRPWQRG